MAQIGVKLGIDGEAEYRRQLNNIIQSTKTLDKQLNEVTSSFDDNTKSLEQNAKETEILQKKAELLNKEVEEMQKMVDVAAEKFGENSTECQKWEASLAQAQTELNKTNSEIDSHNQYAEEASSALGQLTAEIESQTTELDSLRDQYINAVLEFGDTSDEAQTLAGKISNLSGELQANRSALDEATASADALTGDLDSIGTSAENAGSAMMSDMVGQFVPGFDMIKSAAMGAGIADLLSGIIGVAQEVGTKIYEVAMEWVTSMDEMEVATGLTGDELERLHREAENIYLGFNDANTSMTDTAAVASMLNTRLGMNEETVSGLAEAILQYNSVLGVDGVQATNDIVDIMKQYGLVTGDAATDTETAIGIMDRLTDAQSLADVSVTELSGKLTSQATAFQALGMDYETAIAWMVAYRDAGGEVSDISMGLQNVIKNLAGETDDLQGAWSQAVDIMANSTDPFKTMSTEIGNTGKTIEDVFGKKAQQLITTFSNGGVSVDNFSAKLKTSDGLLQQYFTDTRTWEDTATTGLKNVVAEGVTFDTSFSSIFNNLKTGWKMVSDIQKKENDGMSTSMSSTEKDVSASASKMKTNLDNDFKAISTNANSMKTNVSGDLTALKNQMDNTTLQLHIDAPTFTYTKGGTKDNPTFTPDVSYKRYARAYQNAIALDNPTIFGMMGGSFLVGGDRPGTEIVIGESLLLDSITKAVRLAGGQSINVVINGAEGQSVDDLANAVIDKLQMELQNSEAVYG